MSKWKWIFENILVVRPPENRCDSRAPRGLPRPRCGVASHPHSSPTICRRMNGCRALLGERGAWRGDLPGTGPLAPRGGGESSPKNRCDSRAPLGLPPPRGGSTLFPHNSPTICRRKNGRRWTTRRAGASRGRVCSLPGVADNRKYMEIPVSAKYNTVRVHGTSILLALVLLLAWYTSCTVYFVYDAGAACTPCS